MANPITYDLNTCLCRLTQRFRPQPPAKPNYIYTSKQYDLQTMGSCDQGSYIEIYSPQTPLSGNPKAVIYMHGFDLGASQIYGTHLQHLVKQGYYVFYPNFQTGFCTFPNSPWKTFEELAEEVAGDDSLEPQEKWMNSALKSVKEAYEQVGWTESTTVETYLFGHSLGGLFALSWAYYVQQNNLPSNLLPRQVVVADPVPKAGQVDIGNTGRKLTIPVAILHGNDDTIARPSEWKEPFQQIQSLQKKMFLSYTDARGCPVMYANHEQATVDTAFVSDFIALTVLDGVGVENNLNWRYIWYALDQVVSGEKTADQLTFNMGQWSDGHDVNPIEVLYS